MKSFYLLKSPGCSFSHWSKRTSQGDLKSFLREDCSKEMRTKLLNIRLLDILFTLFYKNSNLKLMEPKKEKNEVPSKIHAVLYM